MTNITRHLVAFDGESVTSSTYTSSTYLTADMDTVTISWQSSGAASRLTVSASNEEGLGASITTFSNITTITAQGNYSIVPGLRWLRVTRSALDSLGEVLLQTKDR